MTHKFVAHPSPFKVVWGRVADEIDAAVAGPKNDKFLGERVQIPYECMAVSLDDEAEAHYLCALINSAPARMAIKSYIVLHPDAHVLEHVRLPQFDAKDKRHKRLAELSATAHQLAADSTEAALKNLAMIETQIDETAAAVWDISNTELREIQSSLADLR